MKKRHRPLRLRIEKEKVDNDDKKEELNVKTLLVDDSHVVSAILSSFSLRLGSLFF